MSSQHTCLRLTIADDKGSLHQKKNYGKFYNQSDPPPILAKIMENFKKYFLFYALKKWSGIEINCIFLNYKISIIFF